MTPEQEHDIDNALLTLMYEFKTGATTTHQALKEFKQCLKYYSIMEDVIRFEENQLVDERIIEHYGIEKVIDKKKQEMAEKIAHEALSKGCISFEEVEQWNPNPVPVRHFRMKMEAIIQVKSTTNGLK
jgi:hypothetical protein